MVTSYDNHLDVALSLFSRIALTMHAWTRSRQDNLRAFSLTGQRFEKVRRALSIALEGQ